MKIEKYIPQLLRLDLFRDIKKEQMLDLFKYPKYRIKSYSKGQVINLNGDQCSTMDIILEGKASVQKIDSEGNAFKIALFSSGNIFGVNLMFSSRNTYPMTVLAETDAIVLHIKKELVLELSKLDTHFINELLTVISDKTLVLTDKLDTISMKTVREMITDYLTHQAELQKSRRIVLGISKKELAENFGIQRTSLSRELNKMRKENLIEFDSTSITILDDSLI